MARCPIVLEWRVSSLPDSVRYFWIRVSVSLCPLFDQAIFVGHAARRERDFAAR
jgi:hypothetical protein